MPSLAALPESKSCKCETVALHLPLLHYTKTAGPTNQRCKLLRALSLSQLGLAA